MAEAVGTLDKGKNTLEDEKKNKGGVGEFVRETREELNRTTFPSSEDVRNTTVIVIVAVIFFGLYLFAIDQIWTYLLEGLTWVVNRIAGA